MFTKIEYIRDYRIFRDFSWPDNLDAFARYNVIYGWNGAGKSSLASLFRLLQQGMSPRSGECKLTFVGGDITGTQFSRGEVARPAVRVFDRNYVAETVFGVARRNVPPIFYVASGGAEKRARIDEIDAALGHVQGDGILAKINSLQRQHKAAEQLLDELFIDNAATIKETLRGAGSEYNNYNKANFKLRVDAILALDQEKRASLVLDPKTLEQAHQKRNGRSLPAIEIPRSPIVGLEKFINDVTEMLASNVVTEAIPELAEDPQVEQWVRSGLALHDLDGHATSARQCRFCEGELTVERIAKLQKHFNESYRRQVAGVTRLRAQGAAMEAEVASFRLPASVVVPEHLREAYEAASATLIQQIGFARASLQGLIRALDAKAGSPFEAVPIADYIGQEPLADTTVIAAEMDALERIAVRHADESGRFESIQRHARKDIESHMVAAAIGRVEERQASIVNASEKLREAQAAAAALDLERSNLERNIRDDRLPADELSAELAQFLGRDELRFVLEGDGYVILRGEKPGDLLSEGERTAIAFLHFLKSLQAEDFDLKNGVVVIDDPVSSLDSSSLFSAFAYMIKRTIDAQQLIVLTHNFAFLRQVNDWLGQIKKTKAGSVGHFMLSADHGNGDRSSSLKPLDSLLKDYQSEYHHLFGLVLDGSRMAAGLPLTRYLSLPNIGRRMLEVFLSWRAPGPESFHAKLKGTGADEVDVARIYRFVQTYSHEGGGATEIDMSLLAEAPSVMAAILRVVKHADELHFRAMERICAVRV
jgi:wobble nucleotide-excising tRNase